MPNIKDSFCPFISFTEEPFREKQKRQKEKTLKMTGDIPIFDRKGTRAFVFPPLTNDILFLYFVYTFASLLTNVNTLFLKRE